MLVCSKSEPLTNYTIDSINSETVVLKKNGDEDGDEEEEEDGDEDGEMTVTRLNLVCKWVVYVAKVTKATIRMIRSVFFV